MHTETQSLTNTQLIHRDTVNTPCKPTRIYRPYSGAYSLLANTAVYTQLESRCYSGAFAIRSDIYYTMRVCVTCASNSPEIDLIYQYCQRNDLLMHTGAYIYADESYWIWRIETPACPALTWLLLRYPDQLTVF